MEPTQHNILGPSPFEYAGAPGANPAQNWHYYQDHRFIHNNPMAFNITQQAPTGTLPRVQFPQSEESGLGRRAGSTLSHQQPTPNAATSGAYTYHVKIINPKKKSDFVVRMWHGTSQLFQSATSLRSKLQESFPQDIPHTDDFQMGYIEGNVKRWIFEDQDLQVMYKTFPMSSKITLWCDALQMQPSNEPPQKKRKTDSATASAGASLELDNVDIIFKELKSKHPNMANPKLRLWAKMIDKGRHDDYDNPPAIPLITGSPTPAKKKTNNIGDALVNAATIFANAYAVQPPQPTGSPSKRSSDVKQPGSNSFSPMSSAKLRRSCLEDLKSLNELYQEAVLSETEFLEQKEKILRTLKEIK